MISAPSTSPSRTFWIASSRLFTRTGSIASNRRLPSSVRSISLAAQLDRLAASGRPL